MKYLVSTASKNYKQGNPQGMRRLYKIYTFVFLMFMIPSKKIFFLFKIID